MPVITALTVLGVLMGVYNAWRERPDAKMAEHLRALQSQEVLRKSQELRIEEKIHSDVGRLKGQRLGDLVEMKQGLSEGWIPPAQLGIKGGGLAGRDMPMVQVMAAQMGMDPADLVAKLDPTRSNMYVPASRRGNYPTPTAEQKAAAVAPGPLQLNPMGGFGG